MSAGEVWAPIPGWPYYECSSHGRVRSVAHVIVDASGRHRVWEGRVLVLHTNRGSGKSTGLPRCTLSHNGRRHTYYPAGWTP